MNVFKRGKKPKSGNPDINKSLLQEDAGLGMKAQPKSSTDAHSAPAPTVSEKTSAEMKSVKKLLPRSQKKEIREGYEWDFCLVLPNPEHEEFKEVPVAENYMPPSQIIRRLHDAGLETYQYYSGDWDEIFVKIRAPLTVLRSHAEAMNLSLLMDSNYLKLHVENIKEPIGGDRNHTKLSPYEYIYAPYVDEKRAMFAKAPGYDHPFSSILRIKLIMDIINNDEEDCCNLNLRKIVQDGSRTLLQFYPLHDSQMRDALARNWFGYRVHPWLQPLKQIKEYVGEKIGLYFAFTGHYTTWLVSLCSASIAVIFYFFVLLLTEGTLINALSKGFMVPLFCVFVAVWAQLMLEYWKREQNRLAMEWGQTEFEEEEDERPEFEQTSMRPSLIDGKLEKYFNPVIKTQRVLYSYAVIAGMIAFVLCCVSFIFYLQYYVNSDKVSDGVAPVGNAAVAILSAVQIVLLNMYYSDLATSLNDNENHRTDTEYDDALIVKLFVFMFVNSYAALYFIAFVKTNLGEKCQGPCMVELAIQLTVVFATQLTVSKVVAYVEIVVKTRMKENANEASRQKRIEEGKDVHPMSVAEKESQLEDYDPSLAVIGDYSTIVVQYGYVTLFVAACPIAPLLAYLSNYVELRLDGYKLLNLTKRPIPTGAEDIGTWLEILQIVSVISVITNAALVCYTMQLTSDFSDVGQLWIFIGFQYTIFAIMAIFSYVVDDMPEEVGIQLARQKYLAERATREEAELRAEDERMPTGATRPMPASMEGEEIVIYRTEGVELEP